MRNALERARLRQAKRLVEMGDQLSREDLLTLKVDDFLGSRVFDSPEDGDEPDSSEEKPDDAAS